MSFNNHISIISTLFQTIITFHNSWENFDLVLSYPLWPPQFYLYQKTKNFKPICWRKTIKSCSSPFFKLSNKIPQKIEKENPNSYCCLKAFIADLVVDLSPVHCVPVTLTIAMSHAVSKLTIPWWLLQRLVSFQKCCH
jgi:hypothetical protein